MEYTVKENQTLIDLAIQLYGKASVVDHLLELNPQLMDRDPAWNIDSMLTVGSTINYDDQDVDKRTLKELDGKLIINE